MTKSEATIKYWENEVKERYTMSLRLIIRSIYTTLMFFSIVPHILLITSTMWFMYVGGLPDMITLKLATKPTFYITLVSFACMLLNWLISLFIIDKIK